MQTLGRSRDPAKAADVADVDQLRRSDDALLHQVEQIDAAGLDDGAVFEFSQRLVDRGAIDKRKPVHASSSWLTFPSAASTFAGVIGILRMRTPVAL